MSLVSNAVESNREAAHGLAIGGHKVEESGQHCARASTRAGWGDAGSQHARARASGVLSTSGVLSAGAGAGGARAMEGELELDAAQPTAAGAGACPAGADGGGVGESVRGWRRAKEHMH
jgi:hypothetical protein